MHIDVITSCGGFLLLGMTDLGVRAGTLKGARSVVTLSVYVIIVNVQAAG